MDYTRVFEWLRQGLPVDRNALESENSPTEKQTAAIDLLRTLDSSDPKSPTDQQIFAIGRSLNSIAALQRAEGEPERAQQCFKASYSLLASRFPRDEQPDYFKRAINFAFANLRELGIDTPETDWPFESSTGPIVDLDVTSLTSPATAPRVQPSPPVPRYENTREFIQGVNTSWSSSLIEAKEEGERLWRYVDHLLSRSGILQREIGNLLRADLERLTSDDYLSHLPTEQDALVELTRQARRLSFKAGRDYSERRDRWLLSALGNHALWRVEGGLATNEPQLQIDLLGYVSTLDEEHRYKDAFRDLLLDCAEAEVRIASSMAQVVFQRFGYLQRWVLAGVGTYLLVAGPEPSLPSESYYDERIHSEEESSERGLQRAKRGEWAEILLEEWRQNESLTEGGAFALASICGWDPSRCHWLLRLVFSASTDDQRELSEGFWRSRLDDALARMQRVRVATNPWSAVEPAAARGNFIVSDPSGRLIIPDNVLRAAAAQGLIEGTVATVHGQLFDGRRVPTYLLTNRFGPYAILKIDHRQKVLREVGNFERYAKRLHQSRRPSECVAEKLDMYLGEDGAALRAIQTSYVFSEDEMPLTLRDWLQTNDGDAAVATIDSLMLGALRPWIAHVRRDRVDIRAEYPVVRPTPAPEKQSPENWCDTELQRLEHERVSSALGFPLARSMRECPWLGELSGGSVEADAINPLWFAAEIAGIGEGHLHEIVNSFSPGLQDFETLLCLCHGDLHLENVLCASGLSEGPRTVLIDFESAHMGHLCKDFARLEASLLCQSFEWSETDLQAIYSWFVQGICKPDALFGARPIGESGPGYTATAAVCHLRGLTSRCGQGLWPVREDEYLLALFGAFLPIVRYGTASMAHRRLALRLSVALSTELLSRWQRE